MKKFLEGTIDRLIDCALWGSWYVFLSVILLSMIVIDLITEINFGYWLLIAPMASAMQFFGYLFMASILAVFLGFYDDEYDEEYDEEEAEEYWEWK